MTLMVGTDQGSSPGRYLLTAEAAAPEEHDSDQAKQGTHGLVTDPLDPRSLHVAVLLGATGMAEVLFDQPDQLHHDLRFVHLVRVHRDRIVRRLESTHWPLRISLVPRLELR